MIKNLTLAASMVVLLAISGQAFARATAPSARDWPAVTDPSGRQALNAFDPAMAAQTAEPNTRRYEGGPKSND